MNTLHEASSNWFRRPDDQRYVSLPDMLTACETMQRQSLAKVVPSKEIEFIPAEDHKGLAIAGAARIPFDVTHWSFGQLATLTELSVASLRTLPSDIVADAMNYKLKFAIDNEEVGLLLHQNGDRTLRAATGPRYGRIWDAPLIGALIDNFGDGVTGDWRVPGEFGKAVEVTKANTTLYRSDRDVFVFLADEVNRIEIPNRRDGKTGALARGFFVWNTEVGGKTFGLKTFLFDYVCMNRIVWGAEDVKEIKIRHTVNAPDRFIQEIQPALRSYGNASDTNVVAAIEAAQKAIIQEDVEDFLRKRFSKQATTAIMQTHMLEENRPIETLWDATTAVTAYARSIPFQDARVDIETEGGKLLTLASS